MFKNVILFLIDGVPYNVFNKLVQDGELKNIKMHIIDRGGIKSITSVYPSTTGPAFIPIFMGLYPGEANVPGTRWLSKTNYVANRYGRPGICSYMGPSGVNFNVDLPTNGKTLFDHYPKHGNIYNLLTKGCTNDISKKRKLKDYAYSYLCKKWDYSDRKATEMVLQSIDQNNQLTVCLYPGVDEYAHLYGVNSDIVTNEYINLDKDIGIIVDKLIKEKKYENTLLLITSDHGLTDTHTHIDMSKTLNNNGFDCLEYPLIFKKNHICASMVSGNGMINLYVKPEGTEWKDGHAKAEAIEKMGIIDLLTSQEGIDFITYRSTSGVIIKNKKGTGFITQNKELFSYKFDGIDPLKFNKEINNVNANESYSLTKDNLFPDAFVQLTQIFKSERSGDITISATEGYDLRAKYEFHEHHATHGSMTARQMLVPVAANTQINSDVLRTKDIYNLILKSTGKTKTKEHYIF